MTTSLKKASSPLLTKPNMQIRVSLIAYHSTTLVTQYYKLSVTHYYTNILVELVNNIFIYFIALEHNCRTKLPRPLQQAFRSYLALEVLVYLYLSNSSRVAQAL